VGLKTQMRKIKRRCVRCPRLTANGGGVCGPCLANPLNSVAVRWAAEEAKRISNLLPERSPTQPTQLLR
jgi:hypothetical protein